MRTRVLWLIKGLGPGGAERLLVELAESIDHERYEVSAAFVVPWKDHLANALEERGVTVTCLSRRARDVFWGLRLRRLVLARSPQIVHSHSPVPAVAARLLSATLPRTRRPILMSTEHNTWPSLHPVTRFLNRWTAGMDAATLAVTAETMSSTRGAAARRAELLTHGIDIERVAGLVDERAAVRTELGLRSDEFVIGTIANFRRQKDYPTLLRATRLLVDRGAPVRVLAVGQGPLEDEIHRQVAELQLESTVLLTGYRPDAARLMAAADVFALASAWEGLPVALMEALALGLPVVATRVGGVAEVLTSDDAVLVPPGDPAALAAGLGSVLEQPVRRAALASASRRLAPRFDIAVVADRLESEYDRLVPRNVEAAASRSDDDLSTGRTSRRQAAVPSGVEIRAATATDRPQIMDLLTTTLGWRVDERHEQLFSWKHEANPFGPSMCWVAVCEGRVVAIRPFMRWEFERDGRLLRAVRAVDTATHPDHQGRGLFSALTRHALEACRAEGIDLVFNTPNEQSLPGYLSLGWREVGRITVAMHPRSLRTLRARTAAELWSRPLLLGDAVEPWVAAGGWEQFAGRTHVRGTPGRALTTRRSSEYLRWRYSLPHLRYRAVHDDRAAVIARVRTRGRSTELVIAEQFGDHDAADVLAAGLMARAGADHAVRFGAGNVRRGFLPLAHVGPVLTWRGVADRGMPPLPNWSLSLGDIELF